MQPDLVTVPNEARYCGILKYSGTEPFLSNSSSGKIMSKTLRAEVDCPNVHARVRSLNGCEVRSQNTLGDSKCSIHSVFGEKKGGTYEKKNARQFLRDLLGESAADFSLKLADCERLEELKSILWKDLVKPCAKREAGLGADVEPEQEGCVPTVVYNEI